MIGGIISLILTFVSFTNITFTSKLNVPIIVDIPRCNEVTPLKFNSLRIAILFQA